ncbi:hypothetical protein IRJ41_001434 [Triplophysa rosa]|uniref:Uncharacterized protein n=1 Tax=Triplophysa rosa TaxID=992332 RepID=A0A9W7X268_TRIRA|nr:hypothetical protein IRJ41_001434 [Triplophysa rosa]
MNLIMQIQGASRNIPHPHLPQNPLPPPPHPEDGPGRDSSKDQTIYENDHELRKKIYTGKSQFSSVYIDRPENKLAIYVNSTPNAQTYENCIDNDYENVEMFDGTCD